MHGILIILVTESASSRQHTHGLYWNQVLMLTGKGISVKTTAYFNTMRARADRAFIKDVWIQQVIENPVKQMTQPDGRIKLWGKISEMDNRYLRVILLEDRETVHNAFFDRRYKA